MLNGVGGRTVEEARERLSYAEAVDWADYMRKRGSLNLGLRLEAGFALIAAAINNGLGGHAVPSDFMPHIDQADASIADVMKTLSGRK